MKYAAAVVAAAGAVATFALFSGEVATTEMFLKDNEVETTFNEYIAKHGKSYGTKEEYQFRLNIFAENLRKVEENNKDTSGDKHMLAMNHMADWSQTEYWKILGYKPELKRLVKNAKTFEANPRVQVPEEIDWRKKGAVTPIKDQAQCGSCWAFSATGSMEGAYFNKYGTLKSFSEQQLVDCS